MVDKFILFSFSDEAKKRDRERERKGETRSNPRKWTLETFISDNVRVDFSHRAQSRRYRGSKLNTGSRLLVQLPFIKLYLVHFVIERGMFFSRIRLEACFQSIAIAQGRG